MPPCVRKMRSEPSEQEEEADGISFSFFLPSTNLFESLLAHRSVLWSWTEARFYEGLQSLGRNTSIHFWRYVEVTFFSPFPESLQLLQTHGFLQLRPKVCCLSEAASPPPGRESCRFSSAALCIWQPDCPDFMLTDSRLLNVYCKSKK